jgi:hypothetical protein
VFGSGQSLPNYNPGIGFPAYGSLGAGIIEDNPRGGWQRLLDSLLGVTNGQDQRSKYFQEQYDPWRNRYYSVSAERANPNYGWADFLQEYGGNIGQSYAEASPQQRGEHPSNWMGPMRYVGFPG